MPERATVSATVSAAIVAGGSSRRMGIPKATIRIDGVTLLERLVRAFHAADIATVLIVGGQREWVPDLGGVSFVPDLYPGEGPLGAIVTALDAAAALNAVTAVDAVTARKPADNWVFVVACDLVDPHPEGLSHLVTALEKNCSERVPDVVVPIREKLEVLHALYRTSIGPRLQLSFEAGVRKVAHAFDGLNVVTVPVVEGSALARSLVDVDTVAELEQFTNSRSVC